MAESIDQSVEKFAYVCVRQSVLCVYLPSSHLFILTRFHGISDLVSLHATRNLQFVKNCANEAQSRGNTLLFLRQEMNVSDARYRNTIHQSEFEIERSTVTSTSKFRHTARENDGAIFYIRQSKTLIRLTQRKQKESFSLLTYK